MNGDDNADDDVVEDCGDDNIKVEAAEVSVTEENRGNVMTLNLSGKVIPTQTTMIDGSDKEGTIYLFSFVKAAYKAFSGARVIKAWGIFAASPVTDKIDRIYPATNQKTFISLSRSLTSHISPNHY